MKVNTKFFGKLEIEEKQVIKFVLPILGFENLKSYALLDSSVPMFYYLQSLENVNVCFIILSPYTIEKDYSLDISQNFYTNIKLSDIKMLKDNILVFCIVNIPEDKKETTINLSAPILINKKENLGCQAIQNNDKWSIKARLKK